MAGQLVPGNDSPASILMSVMGHVAKVTGFSVSSASTLYLAHTVTGVGCALLEYLPLLASGATAKSFHEILTDKHSMSLKAFGLTILVLGAGIVIRKIGTVTSEPSNIRRVEAFMYGPTWKPVDRTPPRSE